MNFCDYCHKRFESYSVVVSMCNPCFQTYVSSRSDGSLVIYGKELVYAGPV